MDKEYIIIGLSVALILTIVILPLRFLFYVEPSTTVFITTVNDQEKPCWLNESDRIWILGINNSDSPNGYWLYYGNDNYKRNLTIVHSETYRDETLWNVFVTFPYRDDLRIVDFDNNKIPRCVVGVIENYG